MSSSAHTEGRVLSGRYGDSVWLMRVGEELRRSDGIEAVGVVMGTPRNLETLRARQLTFDGLEAATVSDIVVAARGEPKAVSAALDRVPDLITRPTSNDDGQVFATLGPALAAAVEGALALVSVPGEYVADEVEEIVSHGLDAMVFSDNVSYEDEAALKQQAAAAGRIVMGPDCGTAVIGGVGLGFANELEAGPVGILAASGTGAQMLTTLLDARGVGVSHLIGLGGRDLEDRIGGLALTEGLARLERDPETKVIVVVAKKSGPQVFARILKTVPDLAKPIVLCVLGPGPWGIGELAGAHVATGLSDAAKRAAALARSDPETDSAPSSEWRRTSERLATAGHLRGFYAGGTLAQEALEITEAFLGPVASNLGAVADGTSGHQILDLGADEFTAGRPHPMLDPTPQAERIREACEDPQCGVILFDCVLGHGSHEDPASVLAPAIREGIAAAGGAGRRVAVVGSVCGTSTDPQDRLAQEKTLHEAGAVIVATSAEAALVSALAVAGSVAAFELSPGGAVPETPSVVINIGSAWFADALRAQGVSVIQVDWRPPAGGDAGLRDLLKQLG